MATSYRNALQQVRTFPQLIAFLRDEMGWPVESDDFEDLTYDYTPDELGIDPASAAKIVGIKRLRPLVADQPWGIFFVEFEPKRLPVVALRRILSGVVLRRRASANKADRMAWETDDLLFVSNYGDGDERQISFAHFSQDNPGSLPTLRVLGWDNLDTPLHLDRVAEALTQKLTWPSDDTDPEKWRDTWGSAFTLRHRETITTSRELSIRLAELARAIRDRTRTALEIETEDGPLTRLMGAFREALVHDLDADGFADMYAQTVAYGLLSARIADPTSKTTDDLAAHMRTNPLLRELMTTFLSVGGEPDAAQSRRIDFDELGVSEVVDLLDSANMRAVVEDFGDKNPQEDPVIHFYELFLKEYDPREKVRRGVFYTPRPVVSYIVRSVDELLRSEFDLEDGLADTTTWADMAKRYKDLKIPKGVSHDQAFVQILDPAAGTGTFLVEVIDLIHRTLVTKWQAQGRGDEEIAALWNEYVPGHLLPRVHGYELLMAPYAIAHLKIGLKLYETGYHFGSDERAHIYLTNALEPVSDIGQQALLGMLPALAHEAAAVNEVKRCRRFTVVIGNPPYRSISGNMNPWIREQANHYIAINGIRISEKSKRNPLQNDYVKFLRLGHVLLSESQIGILSMITSSSYLDGRTFRGLRWHWLADFGDIAIVNLNGDSKKHDTDSSDENVFDITEGVAICLAAIRPGDAGGSIAYWSIEGNRQTKYTALARSCNSFAEVTPCEPFFIFRPTQEDSIAEFLELGPALDTVFVLSGAGLITNRDHFATSDSEDELLARMRDFAEPSIPDEIIRSRFELKDNSVWKLPKARRDFMLRRVSSANIAPLAYRPFDTRLMYYDKAIVFNPRKETMTPMLTGKNIAIVSTGQIDSETFSHAFVATCPVEKKLATHYGASVMFSLYRSQGTPGSLLGESGLVLNLSPGTVATFLHGADDDESARGFLFYVYSVLHSPTYRIRYSSGLRIHFPRVPVPSTQDLFRDLARLGGELIGLHLMESSKLDHPMTTYAGRKNPEVGRVGWSDSTVWLDAAATKRGQPATPGTIGFRGVPAAVWNFHIGGYQVCEKWLKDRKGRTLSDAEIAHYQRIVVALTETLRLMQEIDEVIEAHGGWPEAFHDGASDGGE